MDEENNVVNLFAFKDKKQAETPPEVEQEMQQHVACANCENGTFIFEVRPEDSDGIVKLDATCAVCRTYVGVYAMWAYDSEMEDDDS